MYACAYAQPWRLLFEQLAAALEASEAAAAVARQQMFDSEIECAVALTTDQYPNAIVHTPRHERGFRGHGFGTWPICRDSMGPAQGAELASSEID